MARPTLAPAAPRVPAALPPGDGLRLEDGVDWSVAEIGGDFSSTEAARVDITECRLAGASLLACELAHLRVRDSVFRDCELSGAMTVEAAFSRVEFRDCRMLGFVASQARLLDVRFVGCRLDGAEFRMTEGERVVFEECRLVDADFSMAHLTGFRMLDSDLTGAEFSKAELAGGHLHGSTLEGLRGAASLRGVTIDSAQVVPMAYQVFSAIGITVDDEREAG